jgi:hypothetical protein
VAFFVYAAESADLLDATMSTILHRLQTGDTPENADDY